MTILTKPRVADAKAAARPPDSDEFFRQLEAIVSAPEWRRGRLRDFLKHATIFALGLLVISFALALLANALDR